MIKIRDKSFDSDIAVVGYLCGHIQKILSSHLDDKQKLSAIQELKNDVDMAMMLS